MTDSPIRQTRMAVFPEARHEDERMCAVLVAKDDAGNLRAYVQAADGRAEPDAEAVALLVQSVEINNL